MGSRTNWAGNYTYRAGALYEPSDERELRDLILQGGRLRALGSRHSFNAIADAEQGEQVSLRHFSAIEWDEPGETAWAGAGVTYATLARWLDERGAAVDNLASLAHVTVAGAVQTATHGSGLAQGTLASAVTGLELMDAAGRLRRYTREEHGAQFDGIVVAVGALGIVTRVRVRVVPRFDVRQTVYEDLPFAALGQCVKDVFAAGYSVSLFTRWGEPRATQVWVKERVVPGAAPMPRELLGARAATQDVHPLPGHDARNCTEQRGVPGPWHERLPHFRSDYTPSSGNEVQSEYFVPLERGREAIDVLSAIGREIAPHLLVAEMRTVAADTLWLSPCFERSSLALHFTWKPEPEPLERALAAVEAALTPLDPRPHWGKVFLLAPERVRAGYARAGDFRALAEEMDPGGRFRNRFVRRYLFPEQ